MLRAYIFFLTVYEMTSFFPTMTKKNLENIYNKKFLILGFVKEEFE